jgi:glycosyltransferase involved in cell wall biosynthesis
MNSLFPLVSILVPTFNEEIYVRDCLCSILAQDYPNFEVIVFDDCSKDNTVKVIESFKDARLRLIKNPINEKHEKTWNQLLLLATGKYIKLVCSDDLLAPNCVSESVAALEQNPESIMVFCAKDIIDPQGANINTPLVKESFFKDESINIMRKSLIKGTNVIGEPNNVLFRSEAIEKGVRYRFKNYWMVDPDFYIQLAHYGKFTYIPKRLTSFRISLKSWSVMYSYRQAHMFFQYIRQDNIQSIFKFSKLELFIACMNAFKLQILRQGFYLYVLVRNLLGSGTLTHAKK